MRDTSHLFGMNDVFVEGLYEDYLADPASPCRTACMTRNGVPASAAISPMPWLILFAISSPRDCSRRGASSDVLMTFHPSTGYLNAATRKHSLNRIKPG